MTVSMQLTKRIYAGNGLTRQWEIDFPLYSTDDLQVFITSPQGVQTQVTTGFEFNTAGDVLTYPTEQSGQEPLASGWSITLVRHTPPTQQIDLLRQGELDAEVLEQGYDKLTLISQELSERIDRCIKYPVSTQPSDLDTETFFNDVMSAKQAALTASSQAATSATAASASAASAASTAQQAITDITTAKQTAQQAITTQTQTSCQSVEQATSAAVTAAQTAQYYAEHTLGKNVGEVFWSQSSSASDNPGGLPLFTGETISTADQLYPDFYTWVSSHSALQISAADYETALATYGECPKYVIDTTNKTIRLPLLKNYVKMANTTDGITQSGAGLPNITGSFTLTEGAYLASNQLSGVFARSEENTYASVRGDSTALTGPTTIDASRSSSIYGASNTVTPAHTTLYPWVCAYNAAIPASTAQAVQFQNALSGKQDVLPAGTTGYFLKKTASGVEWAQVAGGTSDYADLSNKPSINSVTLSGNKTSTDLGVANVDLSNLSSLAPIGLTNDLATLPNTVGYTVVGSPTIVDGAILSGDYYNCVKLPKFDLYSSDTFEYVVKFKAGDQTEESGSWRYVTLPMQCKATHSDSDWFGVYAYGETSYLSLYAGFKNDNSMAEYTLNCVPGNTYWIKWKKESGVISVSYSTNGTNYTEVANDGGANNTEWPTSSIYDIRLANSKWAGAELYLNDTYIKVDGKYWFVGRWQEINPAHLAMPSDVYEDLTVVKATLYTAPSDGYIYVSASGYLQLEVVKSTATEDPLVNRIGEFYISSGSTSRAIIPISKGQKFIIDTSGTITLARFVYAQGSKSEYTPS